MNAAHLHLLVNHVPIMGTFLALPLLALALLRRDRGLWLGGVLLLAMGALGGVAAMRTGEPAEDVVEGLPGVQERLVEVHEERAEAAAITGIVVAVLAVGTFFAGRKAASPSRLLMATPLAAGLVSAGLMAAAGASGGQIRHSEIRDGAAASGVASAAGVEEEEE